MKSNVLLSVVSGLLFISVSGCSTGSAVPRCELWVDLVEGEPVHYDEVICDLEKVDVVYLGECHTIDRHHVIQAGIIDSLGAKNQNLVIALEQVEAFNQDWLDQYADGLITFDELADRTDWKKRWGNYADYRLLLETGRKHNARFLALNARQEIIRQVGRKGLSSLNEEDRLQLPKHVDTDDPIYEEHLKNALGVMSVATPDRIGTMIEAQISRDEMMADTLCQFLADPKHADYKAIVICARGHVNYGLGTVERVRRRLPSIEDRIVILSASGDADGRPIMMKKKRHSGVSHRRCRQVSTRIGDYLHVVELQ